MSAVTIREAVLAWAARMAAAENLDVDRMDLVIQSDGHVYALPKGDHDKGAVKWWPLPYLGPEGEAAFKAGHLWQGGT
jgi:hypothetical protein